ncbi:hypothetical protein [Streptomyces sp. URMC 123]|uniref:hypothetical protein n=1 Tax=Streptomyces sp. URMC 123 TaxID=3423403 RepID=UPI003F1C65F6
MLALRLARGAHPLVLLRRLLVAAASAGVGFLLLCALGYAAGHPDDAGGGAVRLAWSVVPLAATVHLAAAVARTDPAASPRPGLASAGFGPLRLSLLAAVTAALSCAVGSAVALLVFLWLRGDLGAAVPVDGTARFLGTGQPLPFAGTATLLSVVPGAAALAAALAVRPRPIRPKKPAAAGEGGAAADAAVPVPVPPAVPAAPAGLPWGAALTAAGLALEAYAGHGANVPPDALLPLPGRLEPSPPGVIGGWALTAVGLVLAGPGFTHFCGKLLALGRPGALRLLAGRVLQSEARRIGRPLGVLCAVASGALAAATLYGTALDQAAARPFGPLSGLGAALVMACATATVLTAALEAKGERGETTAALLRLGTPRSLLRKAAALRAVVLVAVLAPVTWVVGQLAALPLAA